MVQEKKVICFITKKQIPANKALKGSDLRYTLFNYIKEKYPDFTANDYISISELNTFRRNYLLELMKMEDEDVSQTEKEVINAITNNKILSENIEPIIDSKLTLGQKAADKIAEFGGSWAFIIVFFLILLGWIILNGIILTHKSFDPYPFILLNLVLSCLAAVQAPIIMMSQNRVEQKDRMRGENDFKINLKAELEIKLLHEKLDHLSMHQNKILFEVQQMQIEYMEDILKEIRRKEETKK
ncbi:MAG: DUF1003 domain-containing protein [Bacteroidales bacterium]|nr:DUF1003 domain-containing protein [Bacteroidales bacterium]